MTDSMYNGLFQYLMQCPQLEDQRFNFDFIGQNPVRWSLQIPTNAPDLYGTVIGDSKKKLDFILVAILHFGDDDEINISNLDGFQLIKKWFNKNNRNKIYPDLGTGKTVTGVFAQTDSYTEGTTQSSARYQIQCRVEYTEANESPAKMLLRW